MFSRGLIILFIVSTSAWLVWIFHQNILFPFFISPIITLLSAVLKPLTHLWITWVIIYVAGSALMIVLILLLGLLASLQVLTRLTNKFPLILKIPVAGKTIGLLIEIFEHRNESGLGYIVDTTKVLPEIKGEIPGIITNAYEIGGIPLCNILVPLGWSGCIIREVKRSELARITDVTIFDFAIFHISCGTKDPFIGKQRVKLN